MNKVTGGSLPAPTWKAFMLAATQGMPVKPLPSTPFQAVASTPVSAPAPTLDQLFGQVAQPSSFTPSGVIPVGTVLPPPHD